MSDFLITDGLLRKYSGNEEVVEVPEGVTAIGVTAFTDCACLEKVILPESVKLIDDYAFASCSSLKEINVGEDVVIRSGAFRNCNSLADEDGFIVLNNMLFGYVGDAENVVIPGNIRSIRRRCFHGNQKIKSVIVPEGVVRIRDLAFESCTNLTHVEIPASLQDFEGLPFWHCTNLSELSYAGTCRMWLDLIRNHRFGRGEVTVHCSDGDVKRK